MKKILLGFMVCMSANCFAGNNNNQNNSDTIYNNGDTYNNTSNQGGTGVGYGGTGYAYQNQGQSQTAYSDADSYSSAASRANADAVSGSLSNSTSRNDNSSGASSTLNNPVTINDNNRTVIPRQAPPATAPSVTGQMGTTSMSGGVSTPLGGISVGVSRTTAEGKALLRAQKTQLDLDNLYEVSVCEGMYQEDCDRIRRQIMRGYGK